MIELKEKLIESMLQEAIQKAHLRNTNQLVSITKQIDDANPIQYFEAAKKTKKDRVFWTSTADDYTLVGVGNAHQIIANETRFISTKEQWKNVIDNAMIHNPYEVPGTGILALGGMSFDPKKERSTLWNKFEHSQFTIPEFTLIKQNEQYYYTVTLNVTKDDDPEKLAVRLQEFEQCLLTESIDLPVGGRIIKKEEIESTKWKEQVRKAKDEINKGQANKIVLAREMRLKLSKQAELGVILTNLIRTQSNCYVFAFEQGGDCFIGATPERLVKLEGKNLLSTCLAGTAPRGTTIEKDEEIRKTLLNDEKNLEEHDYVVKMIRKKIEQYCESIQIPEEPIIYPLKNLHHLYTPVRATLREGYNLFDIIQQLHPTPALGGVPREKSLAFIRENELLDRGWYGAPVGWLDSNQNSEFVVAIRSGLIQGDEASLFAGCGVMKDSNVEAEYEETNIKFLPMLSALEDY